jgi:hypothetical protein
VNAAPRRARERRWPWVRGVSLGSVTRARASAPGTPRHSMSCTASGEHKNEAATAVGVPGEAFEGSGIYADRGREAARPHRRPVSGPTMRMKCQGLRRTGPARPTSTRSSAGASRSTAPMEESSLTPAPVHVGRAPGGPTCVQATAERSARRACRPIDFSSRECPLWADPRKRQTRRETGTQSQGSRKRDRPATERNPSGCTQGLLRCAVSSYWAWPSR